MVGLLSKPEITERIKILEFIFIIVCVQISSVRFQKMALAGMNVS